MKIKHRLMAAALAPALLLLAALFPSTALAIDGDATGVKIPVSVTTSGQGIPGETYTVKIEAETDGAPMPEKSEISVKGEELKAGTYKGTPFELDFHNARIGIYKYRISQVAPKNTTGRGEYDGTVYYMTVTYEHPNGEMNKTSVTAAAHEGTPEGMKVAECNFKNRYANLPAGKSDPPVSKRIAGDRPSNKTRFTFVFEGLDGAPMPEGAKDGKITASVDGEGTIEFGNSEYTKAGVYTYKCYEVNDGAEGYTYDKTVYTVRVAVTETVEGFKVERAIVDKNGKEHDSLTFVNTYKAPAKPATVKKGGSGVVKTGDTNNAGAVVALGVIGAVVVAGAVVMRRDNKKEEK